MRWFIVLLFSFFCIKSAEYSYPVNSIHNGKTILVIYQKSLSHLELWLWDPINKHAECGLLSIFTPAGLQMLPDESGFSFVDNGIIRVKYFNKRSPKSFEFDEPIYGISLIHWIDNNTCYFNAKYHDYHALFQMNMQGVIDCLIKYDADCMYPQKIDNDLFYIERRKKNDASLDVLYDCYTYHIMHALYPTILYDKRYSFNSDEQLEQCIYDIIEKKNLDSKISVGETETILETNYPLAFLHMISKKEGYVLEYPPFIETKCKMIKFTYHQIKLVDDYWLDTRLFSFMIPSTLLLSGSSNQIYESIFPLIPRIVSSMIYFVDASNHVSSCNSALDLFSYDLQTGLVSQVTHASDNQYYFTPYVIDTHTFVGGSACVVESWIDETKGVCIELFDFLHNNHYQN